MPYVIIRTEVRDGADRAGVNQRDERYTPETRRQTMTATTKDAALQLARALAACGQVRNGRQRVKVIRVG